MFLSPGSRARPRIIKPNVLAPPQGRGSLTSGVAITASDVTGATVAYYVLPTGLGNLPLRSSNGSWKSYLVGQLSNNTTNSVVGYAGPAACVANSIYDFFAWNNAGVPTLTRGPPWTSDTARGTGAGTTEIDFTTTFATNKNAITNGPGAGMGIFLFSARTDGSSQLADSIANRWLSNFYNAVPRSMSIQSAIATWTYATNTWRQADANTAYQLDYLQCVGGNIMTARSIMTLSNSGTTSYAVTGIGINSTSVPSSVYAAALMGVASNLYAADAFYSGPQALGRSYGAWLEYAASGTNTVYGTAGLLQSGISGEIIN